VAELNDKYSTVTTYSANKFKPFQPYDTIRYDMIKEFNVDSKAEYSA